MDKRESIQERIVDLVRGMTEIQAMFDRQYEHEWKLYLEQCQAHDLPLSHPVVQWLAPLKTSLSEFRIEANFVLSSHHETGFDVGIRLNGRLMNAFVSLHHSIENEYHNQIVVEVEQVPVSLLKETDKRCPNQNLGERIEHG